jgi:hypothetical protein
MSFGDRELDVLLEEFVRRHLAGEAPDPVHYVRRAGAEGQRLREAIAVFLADSEPVIPEAEAATELARRFGSDAATEGSPASPPRLDVFASLIREWLAATVERRRQLLDGLAEQAFALNLTTEGLRGAGREGPRDSTLVIPLAHPQGARAEVDEHRVLWITVFGLPSELTGSRPLLAFPRTTSRQPGLHWAGTDHGLPMGWAKGDEVKPRGELRAEVGRVSREVDLNEILSEIRVFALPSEESTS